MSLPHKNVMKRAARPPGLGARIDAFLAVKRKFYLAAGVIGLFFLGSLAALAITALSLLSQPQAGGGLAAGGC